MSNLQIAMLIAFVLALGAFLLGRLYERAHARLQVAKAKAEAHDLRFWERESLTVSPEDATRSGGA